MRLLFACLLLLNIVIYMWGSWHKGPPPGSVDDARPPINADGMRLLSEITATRQSVSAGEAPQRAELAAPQAAKVCLALGPFTTSVRAQAAGKKLKSLGVNHQRRVNIRKTIASYRVFLPSVGSRRAAEQKREQLARLGFKDHYIVEEPGKENAISLGVFAVKQNAWALTRRLADHGISAKEEILYNTQTDFWWDLTLEQKDLAKLRRAHWENRRVQLRDRPCVARSPKNGSADAKARATIAAPTRAIYTIRGGLPA